MNRRRWLSIIVATPFLVAFPPLLWTERRAIARSPFETLDPPVATAPEVIEVIEFFHYGCPHCRAFDPLVSAWKKKLPADVRFQLVPVIWNQRALFGLATFYYALAAIGALETLHPRAFAAVQDERRPLYERDGAAQWVREQGGDGAALAKAWDAFSVQTQVKQAERLARDYRIQGVPTLAIAGRYLTSAAHTGSHEAALTEADRLIGEVRRSRTKG